MATDNNVEIRSRRQVTLEMEAGTGGNSHPQQNASVSEFSSPTMPTIRKNSDPEPTRPLLVVKLTGYRLLTIIVIASLGTAKAVLAFRGKSALPTALDWWIGVFCTIVLWWLGLYENTNPPVAVWFFHTDFASGIIAFLLQIVGSTALYLGLFLFYWTSAANITAINDVVFKQHSKFVARCLMGLLSIFVLLPIGVLWIFIFVAIMVFPLPWMFGMEKEREFDDETYVKGWALVALLGLLVAWNLSLMIFFTDCDLTPKITKGCARFLLPSLRASIPL